MNRAARIAMARLLLRWADAICPPPPHDMWYIKDPVARDEALFGWAAKNLTHDPRVMAGVQVARMVARALER